MLNIPPAYKTNDHIKTTSGVHLKCKVRQGHGAQVHQTSDYNEVCSGSITMRDITKIHYSLHIKTESST